ncbi:virulence RhuM family protein [Weissella confusa]|uniref:virulence RhuM family protein n=1 Tax=Weissella confusa TaxID=1583 RepID=UPI0015F3E619|nr:virulence RhuM family protein [Weissella confusa]MBA5932967.1 virulence RhuM family protein [Weissella confusa]MBJ7647994.1 virulence RhuM family protein [Weissella confusa]
MDNESQFLIYNTEDGHDRVELRLDGDTVWLTQKQIAELFDTSVQNVSAHINNILTDLELTESATIKEYLIVQNEGAREINRSVTHYNLDMILAVGYRVRSPRGVQFRRWANTVLKEFLTKGFAMDDVRLKDGGDMQYFKELLARIRDIRSSEKVLYAQLLDIFSTSIDYNKDSPVAKQFFATVQNKLHYAASGHTAAEIIAARADSTKLNMGLTTFAGDSVHSADVTIAKNYLSENEMNSLNRITTTFLDFAEDRAERQIPTKMEDWQKRLDNVLELSEYDVLQGNGSVTKKFADDKAKSEYKKFNVDRNNQLLSQAEIDFLSVIKQLPKDTK